MPNIGIEAPIVLAKNPMVDAGDYAKLLVETHKLNGCEFVDNAAKQAIKSLNIPADLRASDLPEATRRALAEVLERMEVNCANH